MEAMAAGAPSSDLEQSFRKHHRLLWGLCYRMTGSCADADDLLQDTFARALARPPERGGELRPWLVRVAMNLSRDLLRKRRRRGYDGTWLPAPVELSADGWAAVTIRGDSPQPHQARYEQVESASFAFLVALEALTPQQRAVLLLRDVLDYSVRETETALGLSAASVKTTLHRARRAMARYDGERETLNQPDDKVLAALQAFIAALLEGDAAAIEQLLAEDVRTLSDGGGEFFAARVPVVGRERVARFYVKVAAQRGNVLSAALHSVNGRPALIAHFATNGPRDAPWVMTQIDVDATGRIHMIYAVLASAKLAALLPTVQ